MTEAESLAATEARYILEPVPNERKTDRRLRLFRVAVCRTFWKQITIKTARDALLATEKFADNLISSEELSSIFFKGVGAFTKYCFRKRRRTPELNTRVDCASFATDSAGPVDKGDGVGLGRLEYIDLPGMKESDDPSDKPLVRQVTPSLLRDIFGNPFRPVAVDPEWRTSTVVSLAKSMYESRDFSLMPILSDALLDAGCDNADILDHCRGPGPHVRGCWVVDLLLGKE